jgi:hypothetical protein
MEIIEVGPVLVLVPTQAYADRVELAHNRISQAMQYFN